MGCNSLNSDIDYVDYVFLIPGINLTPGFSQSWINTIRYLEKNNISYSFQMGYSPLLTYVRNHLLFQNPMNKKQTEKTESPLIFSGKLKCKKVIFLDSDIVWNQEALVRLLESPYDITAGVYWLSDNERLSVQPLGSKYIFTKQELDDMKDPFEIDFSGMGFVACSFESLSAIKYPWFHVDDTVDFSPDGVPSISYVGEDTYFFRKIREAGFSAYADPKIRVGHQKTMILTL